MSDTLTDTANPADLTLHILAPDKTAIRGTLDIIPACGQVTNLHVETDGTIGFDFGGWAEQCFEDARPVERSHSATGQVGFIFVDFHGAEYHEDDLLRCLPAVRIPDCPRCRAAAAMSVIGVAV